MELTRDTEVTVTLTAGQWSTVLFGLDDQPRRQAQPIWDVVNAALVAKAKELQQDKEQTKEETVEQTE